jgi:hypothetical protein
MGNKAFVLGAVTFAALAVGACEKEVREARTEPAPAPSTTAAVSHVSGSETPIPAVPIQAAATEVAQTQPGLVLLNIDGLDMPFPATKLRLHEHDGASRIVAELFSDLPKSALRKYNGNELYLEMTLDGTGTGLHKVHGATWRFKSTSSGKSDSPNGIFLNGQSTHLQPDDMLVKFEEVKDHPGRLVAHLMGRCRAYEAGTPDGFAPFAGVRGSLTVELAKN